MSDTELLMVRAAELYYDDNKTQDEIGALLGVTRWKAGRLLADARNRGIVRIQIVHPRARRLELETELRAAFGLRDAVVVPRESDRPDTLVVARAAADYLRALRPIPRKLGISWGKTLAAVAAELPEGWATGVDVVQINGSVSMSRVAGAAADTATTIARKAQGRVTLLPSPAILQHVETKNAIVTDRVIAGVIAEAAEASAYLFSAGPADESSALVDSGYLSGDDIRALVAQGAVGDVVGRYITADGTIADPSLDDRTVGLELDALRQAESAIFVVSGAAKHRVAHAVVAHGLCTTLITDEATARSLMAAAAAHSPAVHPAHQPDETHTSHKKGTP